MSQIEKIESIKHLIAKYYGKDPGSITMIRQNDPDFIMRWIYCYLLRWELGLKYREIGSLVYSNPDPNNARKIVEELGFRMAQSRRLRIVVDEIKSKLNETLKAQAA